MEEDLDGIVREYLELKGCDATVAAFDTDLKKLGVKKDLHDGLPNVASRIEKRKKQLISMFKEGRRREFFELWEEYLSPSCQKEDFDCQHLQFYLQIYFAVYPLHSDDVAMDLAEDHMNQYKLFLETQGAQLSQTPEFLPYYALPFIPVPKEHPSFAELFKDSWTADLQTRLEKFLDDNLKNGMRSRLSELVSWEAVAHHQLHQAFNRIAEMTHRISTHQQRFRKIQEDYQKLMGVASELIGSLELAIRGELKDIDPIMTLCADSFPEVFGKSRASSVNGREMLNSSTSEESLLPLNFEKIRWDLCNSKSHCKALLLQALRWRLTQAKHGSQRAEVLAIYIGADLLGCTHPGMYRRTVLNLITSPNEEVRQSMARLLNGFASFREGRLYLAQSPEVVFKLLDNVMHRKIEGFTLDMSLATLQKLSLRRSHQTTMIESSMVEWLLNMLQDHDSFSVYSLEYAVALFMNLCLRSAGKLRCASNPRKVLTVLTDLLGSQNQEIIPYVNGALYSVLSVPVVRSEAQAMAMEDILRCFIHEGNSEMRRQLEFILKQLASDNTDEQHSDDEVKEEDEDDDDDEETQDILEEDLDRDDCVIIGPDDLIGEQLLTTRYSLVPDTRKLTKIYKRPCSSRTEILTRPSTPLKGHASNLVTSAPVEKRTHGMNNGHDTENSRMQANTKMNAEVTTVKSDHVIKSPSPRLSEVIMPASRDSQNRPDSVEKTTPVPQSSPLYNVDVEASEIVGKITGMRKVLAEAINSPVPPKVVGNPTNEYVVAFSTRPKIPRTPENERQTSLSES